MDSELVFTSGVAFFVTLLVLAFRAGRQKKKMTHLVLAITAIITLIGLIWWVEKLVHGRSYDAVAFRIHMACVTITLVALATLIGLGLGLLSASCWRLWHRSLAICFICSLGPTVGTGIWLYATVHDTPPNQIPAGQSARRVLLS